MSKKHFGRKALLGGVLCATTAAFTGSMYMNRKFAKKMEKNSNCNNYMHTASMCSAHIELKADTDNAYLSCIMGALTVELKEIPDHDINIDIYSLCGVLTIKVPEGVKVEMAPDNVGVMSQYNNNVPENNEAVRTIHITGTTIFGCVTVANL